MTGGPKATITLGITVNPKQYHAFRTDITLELPIDCSPDADPTEDQIDKWRKHVVSPCLQRAIYEEVKKLYGEVNAKSMISVYFDRVEKSETERGGA